MNKFSEYKYSETFLVADKNITQYNIQNMILRY